MAEALDRLRRLEFEEATLWVLEDNPRARRFYEIAGWRNDGASRRTSSSTSSSSSEPEP